VVLAVAGALGWTADSRERGDWLPSDEGRRHPRFWSARRDDAAVNGASDVFQAVLTRTDADDEGYPTV